MTNFLDPANALQVAIRAKLLTDPLVTAAFSGAAVAVWDTVPVDSSGAVITAKFPYITLGEGDQVLGQANSCADLSEVFSQVNVWTRDTSFARCREIAAAVRRALDNPLALNGHDLITHTFQSALYRKEPDGLTRRAVMTFRFDTAPWA